MLQGDVNLTRETLTSRGWRLVGDLEGRVQMSHVKAITSGMLRSLDTFGAARKGSQLLRDVRVENASVDREHIRSDWERVGKDLSQSAKRLSRHGEASKET